MDSDDLIAGVVGSDTGKRETHGVGDAVGESHELNVVARTLPVGVEGQD